MKTTENQGVPATNDTSKPARLSLRRERLKALAVKSGVKAGRPCECSVEHPREP